MKSIIYLAFLKKIQGVPLKKSPSPQTKLWKSTAIHSYYRKTYSFKFLCAKLHIFVMTLNVFSLVILVSRIIAKMEIKIHGFHLLIPKISNINKIFGRLNDFNHWNTSLYSFMRSLVVLFLSSINLPGNKLLSFKITSSFSQKSIFFGISQNFGRSYTLMVWKQKLQQFFRWYQILLFPKVTQQINIFQWIHEKRRFLPQYCRGGLKFVTEKLQSIYSRVISKDCSEYLRFGLWRWDLW